MRSRSKSLSSMLRVLIWLSSPLQCGAFENMANSKLRMFSFFHANPGPTPSLTGPRRVRTRDRTSPGGELMTPSRDDSERLHLWPFTTCRATASRWTRPAGRRPRRNSLMISVFELAAPADRAAGGSEAPRSESEPRPELPTVTAVTATVTVGPAR